MSMMDIGDEKAKYGDPKLEAIFASMDVTGNGAC
jgi:hypothetical protein